LDNPQAKTLPPERLPEEIAAEVRNHQAQINALLFGYLAGRGIPRHLAVFDLTAMTVSRKVFDLPEETTPNGHAPVLLEKS
jgi:hypothetical protein